ncbi:VOC family protein [Aureimonas pseudogalii]|uniref:Catechol 2,3-dioxygenase n=1 Tax=Aureimonas pseudogalii TaxID=1744844 RepID=A0A7W6H3T5_9HYPH|nr:VOC family protein [Aureimonas pseudogalii]MBB3998446.1 catechol 2,3-dioxygenase [Aureimonas pseudogalii]
MSSTPSPASADAQLHVGAVQLVVRDLERVAAFYQSVIGLSDLGREGASLRLGVGANVLLELQHDPAATPADPRSAGLFHTAFLLPTRRDLARWVRHVAQGRVALQGASDHGVSEAFYLADPEGNGIEVYADRPTGAWPRRNGAIEMGTERLDVDDLLAAGDEQPYAGASDETVVGHIHLQVGSVDTAEAFYRSVLGFETMVRLPAASFLATGGYHHHVAANVWNSRGAGPKPAGTTGLRAFELLARDEEAWRATESWILSSGHTAVRSNETLLVTDPYGIGIAVRRA